MGQVLEELGYIQAATASCHSPELTRKAPRKVVREAWAAQSSHLLFLHAATQPGSSWSALIMQIFARERGARHPPAKASAEKAASLPLSVVEQGHEFFMWQQGQEF